MSAVKLTSSGKCSKGRSAQGERYLRATKLPQRHMERERNTLVHVCVSAFVCSVVVLRWCEKGKKRLVGNRLGFCLHPLCLHPQILETLTNINASCANFGSSGETILDVSCPRLINDVPLLTGTILNPPSRYNAGTPSFFRRAGDSHSLH